MNPRVLENILTLHAQRYPAMEVQDYVKLLCQSEFGPAHLLSGAEEVLASLQAELAAAKEEGSAPSYTVEAIGDGLCRFCLDPRRLTSGDLPLLCRCFTASARERGSMAGLCEKLGFLSGLAWRDRLPIDREELSSFLPLYMAMDCPTLHHSGSYRETYHPHYRVIDRDLALYFPALQAIDNALRETDKPILVAVDGRCGAGKTTFAARCAQIFDDCSVLHMDDFFLPPEKRRSERLSQPGGNVDHERAEEELFLPLSQGQAAAYRPFNCAAGDFGDLIGVPCARLNIVEGTYALHPALAKYAQVKLFFTCSPQAQLARLERRETAEKLEQFRARWIPLEEAYFSGLAVEASCDVTIDTTHLPAKEETI